MKKICLFLIFSFPFFLYSAPPTLPFSGEENVGTNLSLHQVKLWAQEQPLPRWQQFYSVFQQNHWTTVDVVGADEEESMEYERLQTILNNGSLRVALQNSPNPDVRSLGDHLPFLMAP